MPKKKKRFWRVLGRIIWFMIQIPYYFVVGVVSDLVGLIVWLIKGTDKKVKEVKIENKRGNMKAEYEKFEIIEKERGNLDHLEDNITNKNKIGIILGARGSGKTAFGVRMLENIYCKTKRRCYAIGFRKDEMPSWIEVVEKVDEIGNDSLVLIDEGGVLFSARKAMTTANKMLSDLILISRHKNLTILFISQNSSNLDVNIIRQADFLVFKPSSLLQKDFERKIVKVLYDKIEEKFEKYKDEEGLTYIYSNDFKGFVRNTLPSFWSEKISKSFR